MNSELTCFACLYHMRPYFIIHFYLYIQLFNDYLKLFILQYSMSDIILFMSYIEKIRQKSLSNVTVNET